LGHVDDAARVVEKIVEHFRHPFQIGGVELYVSASIGVTIYPFDETDIKGLLRNADVAMYRAKAKGRNTFEFYAAEMTAQVQEQLSLEGALRRALDRNEFMLDYQPVVDLQTGRITGAEALLRWHHPERGIISPAQFIPLAEETGLIVPIGAWVLAAACAQGAAWRAAGYDPLRLSVNISARQFMQPGLIESVSAALMDSGFDRAWLELEITESLLLQNVDTTLRSLAALHQMGVHLSIDDFGTGYSSLSYLKRFAIDRLKIDRSFVKDIPRDADDAAITSAIIAMAHKLDLRVVAEGVETAEQLTFLRAHGCDAMQGFYFSRPVSADAFTRLLDEGKSLVLGPMPVRAKARGDERA
ncbi:MAG: putative bifunctional diguanylate cyclase/phosphodiesterase, partial [Gammaproteobacteria bacterium]